MKTLRRANQIRAKTGRRVQISTEILLMNARVSKYLGLNTTEQIAKMKRLAILYLVKTKVFVPTVTTKRRSHVIVLKDLRVQRVQI